VHLEGLTRVMNNDVWSKTLQPQGCGGFDDVPGLGTAREGLMRSPARGHRRFQRVQRALLQSGMTAWRLLGGLDDGATSRDIFTRNFDTLTA
jgi:hypothetical protein